MTLTPTQRSNLSTLANYLDTLTAEYADAHFKMSEYFSSTKDYYESGSHDPQKIVEGEYNNCGTSACALGHGPAAGIKPESDNWGLYSRDQFGLEQYAKPQIPEGEPQAGFNVDWNFVFGPGQPNSPWQAAGRIREFLAHNLDPLEKARKILADQYESEGWDVDAQNVRNGKETFVDQIAMRAIISIMETAK